METEQKEQLPLFIDDSDKPDSLPKILFIAGGAIGLIFIICMILASMTKSPSASKIDMPGKSALTKPEGEVAGTSTQNKEVYGAEEPPPTTPIPSTSSEPTTTPAPTSAPSSSNSDPTSTPTPTSKPADPTNTPEPTATQTPTPTNSPSSTETPTPTP
jgi:hypothetical protein